MRLTDLRKLADTKGATVGTQRDMYGWSYWLLDKNGDDFWPDDNFFTNKKIWQTPSKICLMFDNTPRIARALATRLGVELLPAHSHDGVDRVFGMLVNGRLCGCWKDVLKTLNEIERRQNDPS